jgi:hypothetical protein
MVLLINKSIHGNHVIDHPVRALNARELMPLHTVGCSKEKGEIFAQVSTTTMRIMLVFEDKKQPTECFAN